MAPAVIACASACRYDALRMADIERGRPGEACTLCGDCVAACEQGSPGYRLFRLGPERSRRIFLVLVVALHAVFPGVARI